MTMMWLKDASSSAPKIMVDLIISLPEEEDMGVAVGF
jgi:hypothetical protein